MKHFFPDNTPAFLTPAEAAKLLRVSREKVYTWIDRGDLSAINLSANMTGRARYKIPLTSLDDFCEYRMK
jgi:excisionase family DNA binding protein